MGDKNEEPGLSGERFWSVFNVYLANTFIGARLNKLNLVVDAEGNLPPRVVGAICLMLRSLPGTEYGDPRDAVNYIKMLQFLDPYLVPPYRPASNELPVHLYVADRSRIYL